MNYHLNHLKELEAESIYVLREVASQFENPVLMFSGGKDSILMAYLAVKAFYPARMPFPLLHIDTGHNFPETIKFRDDIVDRLGARLIVGSVQNTINDGKVREESGRDASRNALQTVTLLDAIEENKIDCAIGGARRDEEKSRAKERFFSHRDEFGQWNPKHQRAELWNLFNGRMNSGEHFRAFPISNWTEMDVWQYILSEGIDVPSLYIAHNREVVWRNNTWLPYSDLIKLRPEEEIVEKLVRFRTLGDITITGAIESGADSLTKVVVEVASSRQTERGNRSDDKRSETSMEDRKRLGYF